MKYKFIKDLTSDVMFDVYGSNLKELFENSAIAMMSVVCNIKKVESKDKKIVKLKAGNLKELMFNWLQELIVFVDTEEMFFSKFVLKKISETELEAEVYGEPISPEKGETLVKAVTYYKFDVSKDNKGYKARIALDI